MTVVFKNINFDVLDGRDDKYNNTQYSTFKMKPINVKSDNYPECNIDSSDKNAKFKIGDHVTISKYKNIFAKE